MNSSEIKQNNDNKSKSLKRNLELDIPCIKEREQSLKCLSDNNFNTEACKLYFSNYKICNSFWNAVCQDRKKKGIEPNLPPIEERDSVKKEYFIKFNIQK